MNDDSVERSLHRICADLEGVIEKHLEPHIRGVSARFGTRKGWLVGERADAGGGHRYAAARTSDLADMG